LHFNFVRDALAPFLGKGGPNLCHFLGIGALGPFLDRNYFPFVKTPILNKKKIYFSGKI
jgi:hypothetical protein